MTSSIGDFYIANQIALRGARFLLAGSIMTLAVMASGTKAWSQTCSSTLNDTVKICSPVSGSTAASPVQFSAGALDTAHPITGMVLYVDSVNKASSSNAQLTAALSIPSGSHNIVVRAWDSTGFFFSSQETFTVGAPSPTPTPTPTPTLSNTNPDPNSIGYAYTHCHSYSDPTPTPSPTPSGITAVNHIIFMLQENRSFDAYFGMLNPYRRARGWNIGDDQHVYDVDGIDDKLTTISNVDDEGTIFNLFHTSSSCLDDMTSSWYESYGDINRFDFTTTRSMLLDGFVHTAEGFAKFNASTGAFTDMTGERAMAYYADTSTAGTPELELLLLYGVTVRVVRPVVFACIEQNHTEPLATMTGGTTQGYVFDPGSDDHAPQLTAKTIFQLLDEHGVSWKIYYSSRDADGSPTTTFKYFGYSGKYIFRNSSGAIVVDATHIAPMSQYFTDVANGTLPSFSYIESDFGANDEHPGLSTSILAGQQKMASLINALTGSVSWKDSVLFFSYDEGGGPYDHVPPVPGHTNDKTAPALAAIEGDLKPIAVNPDGFLPCPPATPGVYTNHCDLRPNLPGTHQPMPRPSRVSRPSLGSACRTSLFLRLRADTMWVTTPWTTPL